MPSDQPTLSETKLVACRTSREHVGFKSCVEAIARIKRHQQTLVNGSNTNALLDLKLARSISAALITALSDAERIAGPRLEWLLTAASYFCEHADRYHDIEDLVGLEDDADVVSTILEHCDLGHLARVIRSAS